MNEPSARARKFVLLVVLALLAVLAVLAASRLGYLQDWLDELRRPPTTDAAPARP